MKKIFIAVITIALSAGSATAQDDPAAMKKWMDYMTPGDMQKLLAQSEGEWTTESTMWMAPGAPPTTSTGTCVNKMILGGRYLEAKYSGSIMNMPFEGIGNTGYDNAKKVFMSTWIDNMGTGIIYMTGTWDAATKTITSTGKQVDPMTGKEIDIKQVYKFVDDKHEYMEMFMTVDGQEMKTMEMKYTRK
ncbi:DUF1579 domain-containing protein [Foetidibacter luteolus]|uniref:DUF1579 domain-containing protein n=1 Tax=Foetidibacter luteolus TaxID=2608880 RepID=UPI00129A4BAE|nr:DUF1579 domain-containing protein [Foetidibacter luteolus]